MMRTSWLAAAVLLLSSRGQAAELDLPSGEDRSDWQDALVVSGLSRVPGHARIEAGSPWRLVVTRPDGAEIERMIAAPQTDEAREATAILAASLLRPAFTTTLPVLPALPTPEPPTDRPTPKQTPTPAPEPAPAPEPEPLPDPVLLPTPVLTPEPSPTARGSVTAGVATRSTIDQGLGVGVTVAGSVSGRGQTFVDLGGSRLWTPRLAAEQPDRSLVSTNLWLGTGWTPRVGLPAPTITFGAARRAYRFEDQTIARITLPWLSLGAQWDPVRLEQSRGGVRLGFRLERDLRATILTNLSGTEGPVDPWGFTLTAGGRWGQPGSARDTFPEGEPRPGRKSSSL